MAVGRYVSVDVPTKKILSGPFKLDPVANPSWVPGDGGTIMLESAAVAGGYTWPAAPPPDPWTVLQQKLPAAIAANNTFRNLASPTNAQVVTWLQNVVAKELNALLRLVGQLLDDTSDT